MKLKERIINSNTIKISSRKNYVEFTATRQGIVVEFVDNPTNSPSAFITRVDHIGKAIRIPVRLLDLYGWRTKRFQIMSRRLSANSILLIGKPNGKLIKPLMLSKYRCQTVPCDSGKVLLEETKKVEKGVLNTSLFVKEDIIRITLQWGSKTYIEINTNPQGCYTIDTLKGEYGTKLQSYPFSTITYMDSVSNGNIKIPSFWFEKTGLKMGLKLRILKMSDEKVIIAPGKGICDLKGEEIDPIIETPIKIPLCDDCAALILN